MGTFTLTNKAKADLKSLATYTQRKWAKNQRGIYLKQFDDTFHLLADTPDVETKSDFIKLGYRKFPNISHVIFYRTINDTQIEIIRILHKRMDIEKNLKKPSCPKGYSTFSCYVYHLTGYKILTMVV
jgi:toxin ParE1/3/4